MRVREFTDAMCSWAWGTEPKLRLLHHRFDDQIDDWRHVLGHLVEDEHMPERDPVETAPKLEKYWKVVCDETGMPRPAPLHRATAGSRASGLTIKAAGAQGDRATELVMRRMREATFVYGEPPDSRERALASAAGLEGVDGEQLAVDAASEKTAAAYLENAEETRNPNEYVRTLEGDRPGIGKARQAQDGRMRFVFPTLVFSSEAGERTVPGWMPYDAYEQALFDLGAERTERTRSHPSVEEAFARWPSMAAAELAFVCGAGTDAELPDGVIAHRWDGGELFLTAGEAEAMLS